MQRKKEGQPLHRVKTGSRFTFKGELTGKIAKLLL
jgi:hypothetical protein